ncbi:MAG: flagellar filament outer layer protein FlaA [Treponema sp.]|nr:flagellar filament outer layer protein FlaA [Treponema sp.]
MKRIIILVAIAAFSAGMLVANESVLIDFSLLSADIRIPVDENDMDTAPNQNRRTVMDFGQVAGASFTPSQRALMRTSLAIESWDVVLNSSARTIHNITRSYTREAPSRRFGTVMGARVHFPLIPAFSHAFIRPPFEIPAYEPMADIDDQGNIGAAVNGFTGPMRFEEGFGVVRNVGTIRSVAVNVYGLNFPHGLNVILLDHMGNERTIFMGHLNFDGWGELVWNNPQYIFEVRHRDVRLFPLYPHSMPFVKFGGFRVDRDAANVGGDFIVYFRDVRLIYDLAVLDTDRDIDDEGLWGIISDREMARRIHEMERFGQQQILRFVEGQTQARSPWNPLHGADSQERFGFTPPADQ